MTFITTTGYDVAAIMRDAHRRAKKVRAAQAAQVCRLSDGRKSQPYADTFSFFLGQVWILAQHEHRARLCTGATVTVAKAFDNNNSPVWRM